MVAFFYKNYGPLTKNFGKKYQEPSPPDFQPLCIYKLGATQCQIQ